MLISHLCRYTHRPSPDVHLGISQGTSNWTLRVLITVITCPVSTQFEVIHVSRQGTQFGHEMRKIYLRKLKKGFNSKFLKGYPDGQRPVEVYIGSNIMIVIRTMRVLHRLNIMLMIERKLRTSTSWKNKKKKKKQKEDLSV